MNIPPDMRTRWLYEYDGGDERVVICWDPKCAKGCRLRLALWMSYDDGDESEAWIDLDWKSAREIVKALQSGMKMDKGATV